MSSSLERPNPKKRLANDGEQDSIFTWPSDSSSSTSTDDSDIESIVSALTVSTGISTTSDASESTGELGSVAALRAAALLLAEKNKAMALKLRRYKAEQRAKRKKARLEMDRAAANNRMFQQCMMLAMTELMTRNERNNTNGDGQGGR